MVLLDWALTVRTKSFILYVSSSKPQHMFAAREVAAVLASAGFTCARAELSSMTSCPQTQKIVFAETGDAGALHRLREEEGGPLPELGREAYAIRISGRRAAGYWVIGGDAAGVMYGGLRLAEKMTLHGVDPVCEGEESPFLKNRGIKFNLPLDLEAPTYFEGHHGTSHQLAIRDVWDLDFWTAWFDEMARHRFNALSLWSPHPFTSMLNMEDEYPGIAIEGVRGFDIDGNIVQVNRFSITEKIAFWQTVMKKGRDRGIAVYVINWNVFLSSAEGKHGLTPSSDNPLTSVYLKKCIRLFLETYPDLAGFGITPGERMPGLDKEQREAWAWETFGSGFLEYAKSHPERNLTFIHRQHDGELEHILRHFSPLNELPNVTLELSCKYSEAHAHSTTTPSRWQETGMEAGLRQYGIASWLEVRNDDFHFLHWAESPYVRAYISAFPEPGRLVCGFFIGADGWVHTREFVSLNPFYAKRKALSVQRTWLMHMIWGRLSYNPSVPDTLLIHHLEHRFPGVPAESLFEAWTLASRSVRLANEQVTGGWRFDNDFWIERWTGDTWEGGRNRHFTLKDTQEATPFAGSRLCSFSDTVNGRCADRVSAWETAEAIGNAARRALKLLETIPPADAVELYLTLRDLTAQAHLGLYCAEKFRAVLCSLEGNTGKSREYAEHAADHWKTYTGIMGSLYRPVQMQRNKSFQDWEEDLPQVYGDLLEMSDLAAEEMKYAIS